MKKLLITLSCIFLFILLLLIWWDQGSKSFYCFSDGKCFTIWKRVGGKCYLIPQKYHGIIAPNDEYLLTSNSSSLGIIRDKKNTNSIIVIGDSSCYLFDKKQRTIKFYNEKSKRDSKEFDSLYTHSQGDYKSYNTDLEYYNINILEMAVETNVKIK